MSIGFVLPPSKSQTLRALIFAFLAEGKSVIYNPLFSPDTSYLCKSIDSLGGTTKIVNNTIEVIGCGGKIFESEDVLFSGNSGIIYRFMTALSALSTAHIVITGDDSIRNKRPIEPLLNGLKQYGVNASSLRKQGGAPILIQGPLQSGKAVVDGSDSQTISALLIACAIGNGPFEIVVEHPGELPWIDLTLSWLDRFHISYQRKGYDYFCLPGKGQIPAFQYEVPGDVSASLFLIGAALITKRAITIDHFDPTQGDRKCIDLLREKGANIRYEGNKLFVEASDTLAGGVIDVNPFIDALPVLAVLACFAKEKTQIVNGKITRSKECDRIKVMCNSLTKMGAHLVEEEGGLTIYPSKLQATQLHSFHDHRIAMALTIATLGNKEQNSIEGKECVEKSFPSFFDEIKKFSI